MDRSGVTVHRSTIHLFASPHDTVLFELECRDEHAARVAAARITEARATKNLAADTPLYAAMLAWAWWGTHHLDRNSSWPAYRSRLRKILDLTGGVTMGATDRDWYSRLHDSCLQQKWTVSNLESLATVIAAFATWCISSRSIWDGPRPGGTSLRQIHSHYRSLARSNEPEKPLLRTHHCPGLTDVIEFGATLGEAAADRWGEDYACWAHAPRIQFLTGCRLMELPVLRADSFELAAPHQAAVHIAAQYKDGNHRPGKPNRKPTKNKTVRNARIWESQHTFIQQRCAEAADRPGGLLLPIPPGLKTGTRQLQDLYKQSIDTHKYSWTSHAHRHAYISWNLANPTEGGYGCSPARVANWVGHHDIQLITRRYWSPTESEPSTSHSPGERQL